MRAENDVGIYEQRVRVLVRDRRELLQQPFLGAHLSRQHFDAETRSNLLGQLERVGRGFRVLEQRDP